MLAGHAACPQYLTLMSAASSPNGLERIPQQVLDVLRCQVYKKAQFADQPTDMWITFASLGGVGKCSTTNERVVELDELDLRENVPSARFRRFGTLHGAHSRSSGKIFLVKDSWCLKTLIHETLHCTAITVKRPDLDMYQEMFEGLTEFYTGYTMFRQYTNCYQAWKKEDYEVCSIGESVDFVRLLGAICHFVSIDDLAAIYFWQGHGNWEDSFRRFVQSVRRSGYPKFRNILKTVGGLALRIRLIDESRRAFGKARFDDVFESREKSLDYATMIP